MRPLDCIQCLAYTGRMANRSYLYTYHPGEEPEYRDVSEWNAEVPVAHLLLVGANPTACPSAIWQVEESIAIKGDGGQGRSLLLAFLDWLEPQVPNSFQPTAQEAHRFLARPDRQSTHFHLEPGEIYELMGLTLEEMERETLSRAALARELYEEAHRLVETDGTTLDDAVHQGLKGLKENWEALGLDFSRSLYFHLGD